jgi:hypothetical protein
LRFYRFQWKLLEVARKSALLIGLPQRLILSKPFSSAVIAAYLGILAELGQCPLPRIGRLERQAVLLLFAPVPE